MLAKQLAWASTTLLSLVTIYLAVVQVSSQLPKWSLIVVGSLVLVASILSFPFGGADGNPTRVFGKIRSTGPTFVAGDNATQIHNEGDHSRFHIDNRRDN